MKYCMAMLFNSSHARDTPTKHIPKVAHNIPGCSTFFQLDDNQTAISVNANQIGVFVVVTHNSSNLPANPQNSAPVIIIQ